MMITNSPAAPGRRPCGCPLPDPRERQATQLLTPRGLQRRIEQVVETVHPRPRGTTAMPVGEMERALTALVQDTAQLAAAQARRAALIRVNVGDDMDDLIIDAEREWQHALSMFDPAAAGREACNG